jgi:hypothetical protein
MLICPIIGPTNAIIGKFRARQPRFHGLLA